MSNFGSFHRYWLEWKGKLDLPIKRNSSRLIFPQSLNEVGKGDGVFELSPTHPLCIYNAPQKGSSTKRGASHKQAIFIDGTFTLRMGESSPYLVKGTCNISFFDAFEGSDQRFSLKLVDAMHFDMELRDAPTAFHPTFHVQRGVSNTLSDDAIKNLIFEAARIDRANIEVDRNSHLGTPYLRLPTPQMDMFSVLTMIIADFFCNGGDKDENGKDQFKAILKLLVHDNNAAREGFAAKSLRERFNVGYSSSAHWYPEFVV